MRHFVKQIMVMAVVFISVGAVASESANSYKIEFTKSEKRKGKEFPRGWAKKGTKWGIAETKFYIRREKTDNDGILVVEANKATGAILLDVYRYVDLKKTPIMRWRWRAKELPKGADGRYSKKDDQVMSIYIGAGSLVRKSIAYRWETETPIGSKGKVSYGGGLIKVAWECLNNKTTPKNKWIVEERNIAADFKKAYGNIPKEFAISIGGNSQYTDSRGLGEIDFIEFLPANSVSKN